MCPMIGLGGGEQCLFLEERGWGGQGPCTWMAHFFLYGRGTAVLRNNGDSQGQSAAPPSKPEAPTHGSRT